MPVEVGCAELAETNGQVDGAAFAAHTVLGAGCSHPSPGRYNVLPGDGGNGVAPVSAARSGVCWGLLCRRVQVTWGPSLPPGCRTAVLGFSTEYPLTSIEGSLASSLH